MLMKIKYRWLYTLCVVVQDKNICIPSKQTARFNFLDMKTQEINIKALQHRNLSM